MGGEPSHIGRDGLRHTGWQPRLQAFPGGWRIVFERWTYTIGGDVEGWDTETKVNQAAPLYTDFAKATAALKKAKADQ